MYQDQKLEIKSEKELSGILREIKKTLLGHYGSMIHSIVLFGSYAKGSQKGGSDIDISIVFNEIDNKYKEIETIVDLTNDISLDNEILISFLPISIDEFNNGIYPIFTNIRKEGIVV